MGFFLQDVTSGKALSPENTLAKVTVRLTTGRVQMTTHSEAHEMKVAREISRSHLE